MRAAGPLDPWRPSAREPWDLDAAAHLRRRAAFGAPLAELQADLREEPGAVACRLVDGPAEDPPVDELESIFPAVMGGNDADGVRAWLVARMARTRHPLREKMALFWHDHFATSIAKVKELPWMVNQYRLFLDHGLGRFPGLLEAVARDPAMIRWLDNESNTKGHPNENFARELFELFTLGVGNYTETDIREAGRAFTGWHLAKGSFHFSEAAHDGGTKSVLGTTGPLRGEDVLRLALEQPACAEFLAFKLLREFVHPEPGREAVAQLGTLLRESGYDLSATLRVLLASRLFFSAAARRARIKSPAEYLVGAARTFAIRLDAPRAVEGLRAMGQDLLAPPNVKGWPGHRLWIQTATWLVRLRAADELARAAGGVDLDEGARALLGRPVAPAERETLATGCANGEETLRGLLALPEAHLS